MKGGLKVAIIQYDIVWENPSANRQKIELLLSTIHQNDVDLIILPEMFTTGFSMNTENIFEVMGGTSVQWMKQIAEEKKAVITGSIIIKENDLYYNRLLWVRPDHNVEWYYKRHLFTLAKEHHYFTQGSKRQIFELQDQQGEVWRICPLICYDLRFPVWSRNNEAYDLLIYVANFPEKRNWAWTQLLISRAIENQAYVVGVNRIGSDGVDISYIGNSVILDYEGKTLAAAKNEEKPIFYSIDKHNLNKYRRAYQFLNDQDSFEINKENNKHG